jgi:phosphatidylglycerophosphatase A
VVPPYKFAPLRAGISNSSGRDSTISVSAVTTQPSLRFLFSHPAHVIALGFGAGLSPAAPGTVGTLIALPIYVWLSPALSTELFALLLCAMFATGTWACQVTGRHLGVHDHGAMVWDEVTAFMLVLFFTPAQPMWQAFAFLLFRGFDILKPPPIRRFEANLRNGLGVMFDDLLAAFYALLCMALYKFMID